MDWSLLVHGIAPNPFWLCECYSSSDKLITYMSAKHRLAPFSRLVLLFTDVGAHQRSSVKLRP